MRYFLPFEDRDNGHETLIVACDERLLPVRNEISKLLNVTRRFVVHRTISRTIKQFEMILKNRTRAREPVYAYLRFID